MNKCILIGRLGKDPEMRYMPGGDTAVCNMALATSKRVKDTDYTEWHRIVVFGKLAEICGKHLSKGKQVMFEGEIRTKEWEKDGIKRYNTEIVCNQMEFLSPKSETSGAPAKQAAPAQNAQPAGDTFEEDDIPF